MKKHPTTTIKDTKFTIVFKMEVYSILLYMSISLEELMANKDDSEIKVFNSEEHRRKVMKQLKGNLGFFIKTALGINSVFMPFILLSITLIRAGGLGIPLFVIVIIITLIENGIYLAGCVVAIIKAVFTFIDLVPLDGIGTWILRIVSAGSGSWWFVFS